jgi:AhpD family alkylhydroperoxidase
VAAALWTTQQPVNNIEAASFGADEFLCAAGALCYLEIQKETVMYDAANLKKLAKFGELAPAAWAGFLAFDRAAMSDGAIPAKMKELIAVAVAVTTQCPYCIDIHTKRAKGAGCTEAELAEAVLVAAALRAGGSVTHGTHSLT